MKQNDFHQLVLTALQELNKDMKEVRQSDIPAMKESFARFKGSMDEKIESLEKRTSWSNRLYTVLGGTLAILVAKFTGTTH